MTLKMKDGFYMTLSPLLYEFFYHDCDKDEAIRVHCPSDEQAGVLRKLAECCFCDFSTEYLSKERNPNHRYFFWDTRLLSEDKTIGFNAYNHGNDRTYKFEDFIKEAFIIEDEDETNISDVEELL